MGHSSTHGRCAASGEKAAGKKKKAKYVFYISDNVTEVVPSDLFTYVKGQSLWSVVLHNIVKTSNLQTRLGRSLRVVVFTDA
jgi:hypothetical protein